VITVDFNRININPGDHILDLGCGTGRHTCGVFRFRNVFALGIDLQLDGAVEAEKRLKYQESLGDHGGGVYGITVAEIKQLPFKDNGFDLVICSEVLEHIHDDKTAVAEAVRVLKPGKNLVVSVPRFLPEQICWALSEDYHTIDNGHVRIYKKKEIVDLLESAGLKVWGLHFAHSLHAPYWWLKCYVGPTREDSRLVNLYHRLLVWDIMKKPRMTRLLDRLLNPVLGKSMVIYLRKEDKKNGS
jgi:SAM-dependent methyltransferase